MKIVIELKQSHQEGCGTPIFSSHLQPHHRKERGGLERTQAQRERIHVLGSVALAGTVLTTGCKFEIVLQSWDVFVSSFHSHKLCFLSYIEYACTQVAMSRGKS